MTFADIPESVIDHVRRVFAAANDKAARTLAAIAITIEVSGGG